MHGLICDVISYG